ncbi:MAG: hypothetical protein R3C11_27200 [Planctomycetaceae bacterium]
MLHDGTAEGEAVSYSQTVPNIDYGWTDKVSFYGDLTYQQQIADELWNRAMDPTFISNCIQNGERHPFLKHCEDTVEGFSTPKCTTILTTMLSQPDLLGPFQLKEIVDVYRSYRLKDLDKALDLFGTWAHQNKNHPCRMPYEYLDRMGHFKEFHGFDFFNQRSYRFLAICIGKQSPTQLDLLRDEYLETAAGECCLPVAYTLGYAYLGQERLDEWVALLTDKLNDQNLQGEQRVNWLLARAQAHEIRLGPVGDPYAIVNLRPMDGLTYIEEAILSAELPETKMRLTKERAARLSSANEMDAARLVLQEAAASASPEDQLRLTEWTDCVNRFEAARLEQVANQDEEAKQNHLDRLRSRLEQATTRGDTKAIERYTRMIEAAENQ